MEVRFDRKKWVTYNGRLTFRFNKILRIMKVGGGSEMKKEVWQRTNFSSLVRQKKLISINAYHFSNKCTSFPI